MPDDSSTNMTSVRDVVRRLEDISSEDTVTLERLFQAFGSASFVPALMVPALLVVSPLSGIPFFSSICGLTIALIALQMVVHRTHLWLPRFLMHRRIKGRQLKNAMGRIRRIADWIDGHSKDRLRLLCRNPGVKIVQVLAMLSGACMPFLELVPFSSSILGTAVLLFSVSFLARDGVYAIAGMAVMGIASAVPLFVWNQITG